MVDAGRAVLVLAAVASVLAGCGGGGDGAASSLESDSVCALVDRMASSADPLVELGPDDPEAFRTALDGAVLDLVSTLDALLEVVPDDVADDVEEMRGLVEQHRFQDAIEARASLDEYAQRVCVDSESG